MIEGIKPLYRVTFKKKSIYCGYDINEAGRKYFELEPEATAKSPLEWHLIMTPGNPLHQGERQLLRRMPGKPGIIERDFDLTPPPEDE
jgi:hypothetical protein